MKRLKRWTKRIIRGKMKRRRKKEDEEEGAEEVKWGEAEGKRRKRRWKMEGGRKTRQRKKSRKWKRRLEGRRSVSFTPPHSLLLRRRRPGNSLSAAGEVSANKVRKHRTDGCTNS